MKKYSSIAQFRNVIRTVKERHDYVGRDENGVAIYKHVSAYPTLTFTGTVKVHGTNAGIVKYKDRLEFQSRDNVLSLTSDNMGFMNAMHNHDFSFIFDRFEFNDYCAVYGEWSGGNIQKGVAINGLPKMFIIFGIKVDDEWVDLPSDLHNNDISVYNILQFPTFTIDIDFNRPELVQNKLIEMTVSVEDECPVGKFFGKEGAGEGIVFTAKADQYYKFKSKGEKHSVSKVKKLNSVNVEELNSIVEFVEATVTENRLKQGLEHLTENGLDIDVKNTGIFIRWVVTDVLKEESDTMIENGLDQKKVSPQIATKARMWFLNLN